MSRDPKRDQRIDDYIAKAQPFAQPILTHIRDRVHAVVPKTEETLKWSMPSFTLDGKILLNMAAFEAHAAMGQLGRLTSVADLPGNLDDLIRRAELTRTAPSPRKAKGSSKAPSEMHPAFAAALAEAPKASATLDAFPPSAQRAYLDWIAEAKQDSMRHKRIATAVEWLNEGKRRHWKYQNC